MTAVEWLWEQIDGIIPYQDINTSQLFIGLLEQAKEMEKQQISKAWYAGDEDGAIHDFEQYYNETYGSKGSGKLAWCDDDCKQCKQEMTSSQTEISDEEIIKYATENGYYNEFLEACRWYREQLKSK